jgi:hypothetical protein
MVDRLLRGRKWKKLRGQIREGDCSEGRSDVATVNLSKPSKAKLKSESDPSTGQGQGQTGTRKDSASKGYARARAQTLNE